MSTKQKKYILRYLQQHRLNDDEGQAYRLQKISETEKFLRDEIDKRDSLTKRFKRRAAATSIGDTSVIAAIIVLGGTSISLVSAGIGIALIPILAPIGLSLGLGSGILHGTRRIFDSKAGNTIKSRR